jgi:uncharacterized lipoprotein YddW (UPF0748 family)
MKRIYLFLVFACLCHYLQAQPKQEIRAVWLTTNYGLDWPKKPARNTTDIQTQKAELDRILDQLQAAHINLVFLQTRLRGDVIYPSEIEPRSEHIKAHFATADYDPLAYAVEACHQRGLECHAWFVVYPSGNRKIYDLTKSHKGESYLDPGNPQTTPYLLKLIHEIVSLYDIDGLHLDYVRYPDDAASFPDESAYRLYGNGESKNTWRRENINQFVYAAYDTVKSLKPWVQVSSSTIGMYDNMPQTAKRHWTAYHSVFQDPADWLEKGKHDFIVPMMYYSGSLFFPFVPDWLSKSNGRLIVPGLGLYQMDRNEANWDSETLLEQIQYCRDNQTSGNAFFRANHLVDNKKGILDKITGRFYTHPALLPPLPWLSNVKPDAPAFISAQKEGNFLYLSWEDALSSGEQAVFYNLYRSEDFPVDTNNPDNLIAVRMRDNQCKIHIDNRIESGYYYVVTNYDRYHNESENSDPVYFVTGNYEK